MTAAALLYTDLAAGLPIDGAPALFNRFLHHLIATRRKTVADFEAVIDHAEDRVFDGASLGVRLGPHRRAMARLRRQLSSDRHVLAHLFAHPPAWWPTAARAELRRIGAALAATGQDLELTQDRARLLSEEVDSRQIERTNRNIYFVTIAATLFLPMTVMSSIFGMNVGGLPWVEHPNGFVWAMACMLVGLALAVLLVVWRRMLKP